MTSSSHQFISIIVPCFNEEKFIKQCLESLVCQNYPKEKYEIIVIDNGSTDNTLNIASEYDVITKSLDKGNVGAVRNLGTKLASGQIYAFIDGDCIAPNNWLSTINNQINTTQNIAIGGAAELSNNANWLERYWLLEAPNGMSLPKELLGCSLALSSELFKRIGGFNESVSSGEDTIFSLALRKSNATVKIIREMNIVHLGNARSPAAFIKRQIWHSENYTKNLLSSIQDPVFILTITFYLALVFNLTFIALSKSNTIPFLIMLIPPAILSFKRIIRSNNAKKYILFFPIIFTIDVLYLLGRCIGVTKGIIKR